MSNHAYILPRSMPSVEQIDRDAREICARKFPQFVLEYEPRHKEWRLHYPTDERLFLRFWVGRYRRKPCIEFRHSYSVAFMWWLEYEIREELALRYDSVTIDEGLGEYLPPQRERYDTYADYLRGVYPWHEQAVRVFYQWEIQHFLETLPEELQPLVGKNLEPDGPDRRLSDGQPGNSGNSGASHGHEVENRLGTAAPSGVGQD